MFRGRPRPVVPRTDSRKSRDFRVIGRSSRGQRNPRNLVYCSNNLCPPVSSGKKNPVTSLSNFTMDVYTMNFGATRGLKGVSILPLWL